MANDPEAEFRESMYGHATNTPTAIHESTTKWLDAVYGGGIAKVPPGAAIFALAIYDYV